MNNNAVMQLRTRLESEFRYSQLGLLFSELNTRNIRYAVIKGEPLSYFLFNEFGRRKSNDIDILIDRTDISSLENILKTYGFEQNIGAPSRIQRIFYLSQSHQLNQFTKRVNNLTIRVDINFDIMWGENDSVNININSFLGELISMNIYGFVVSLLVPINAFIQLCLHHYKEMNSIYLLYSYNSLNIDLFRDIDLFIHNKSNQIFIKGLCERCEEYNIKSFIYYILYYTNVVFPSSIANEYVRALRSTDGDNLLNYYGLHENERKEWRVDFITRLNYKDLYFLIKDDLTNEDLKKIEINKKMFI